LCIASVIFGCGFRLRMGLPLTVDPDLAFANEHLGIAAGADAGFGEVFLEADGL
jgi:hypothetical protein